MTTPPEEYRLIPLTDGQFAKVDVSDYEELSKHRWFAMLSPTTKSYYSARYSPKINGKIHRIWMHKEILGLKKGDVLTGDHAFRDTLDNRRTINGIINLRPANASQQCCNRGVQKNNRSGFKGVSMRSPTKFQARIQKDGKMHCLGYRSTPELASELYKEAALKFHGEFAVCSDDAARRIILGKSE